VQLNKIIHSKFNGITYSQKGLINDSDSCLVIRLGQFKIICDTFVRIYYGSQILLINTDIHLNDNYQPLPDNIFYSKKCYKKSLLHTSVQTINKLCQRSFVDEIQMSENGDLLIIFSNNISIELLIDINNYQFIYYQIYAKNKLIIEKRINELK